MLRHNKCNVLLMTIPLVVSTGNVTGKIVAVALSLAIQTGTHATGTSSALTKTQNMMISMGILSVSRIIQSKIAIRMTPMAHIMIAIGSTKAVNNSAKMKAGMIASGTTLVTTKMKIHPNQAIHPKQVSFNG